MSRTSMLSLALGVGLVVPVAAVGQAHTIKDAESATHGDDAARYSIVDTYKRSRRTAD